MNVTRRWFLGGAASFGAFGGCRMFADPTGGSREGRPNLVFGVISDIHIIAENVDNGRQGNTWTLEHALRWFDSQGADGVLIAGDMADGGLISHLQSVADAWYKIFPDDRSAVDGRKVEKLFIYGNHDWEGQNYGYNIYGRKSSELRSDHLRRFGMKKAWERIFNEEYNPIYRKTVKGYDFIGAHWDGDAGFTWGGSNRIERWFAENGGGLDPAKPFFYFQHPHPKDTCYGEWAWGRDSGQSTRALSRFPNAVAFSGHSHYSLLDGRSIWQGSFTSLGTGSLRYAGSPDEEFAKTGGYENAGCGGKIRPDGDKSMSAIDDKPDARNGYLVRVFSDRIVYQRRDFVADCDLGPDWVTPPTVASGRPFEFAARAAAAAAPAFDASARVKAERCRVPPRKKIKVKTGEKPEQAGLPAVRVSFPPATAAGRVWRYEVKAEKEDGSTVLVKNVLSPDYHLPRVEKEIKLAFFDRELPADAKLRFSVTPFECYGRAGKSITSETVG
ncbi:MAG: metallophosphoesterase [Kiritimatiellae bacterium]|nr:metallophosphoesterase [Kiritimatiellia bacterium]